MFMKKFRITDEDGNNYEVEEIEEEITDEEMLEEVESSTIESLTADEIVALKKLAAAAPSILELVTEEPVEDEEVEMLDEEEVESEEEIVDSEETKPTIKSKDSKKSYGSLERIKKLNDSVDAEQEIAEAWSKRYGGR